MIAEGMVNAWKGAWKTIVKLSKTGWQGIKNLLKGKLDFSEFGKAFSSFDSLEAFCFFSFLWRALWARDI